MGTPELLELDEDELLELDEALLDELLDEELLELEALVELSLPQPLSSADNNTAEHKGINAILGCMSFS